MSTSLLSHLALRFASHPENIATEALAYILDSSDTCSAALSALVGQFCSETGACRLHFQAQASGDDLARPDLVGRDSDGQTRLIIEAKFWAGLTDNQPVAYLEALAEPGALIFVAPEARIDLLWPELIHRLRDAGHAVSVEETQLLRSIRLANRTVAVVSWRVLLGNLLAAAENARETAISSDIRQLDALCERMDSEAFLPLTSEDLNPYNGRRIAQFAELASRLTDLLVSTGAADVKGLRAAGGQGWSGRYVRLRQHGCFLHFSADGWAEWGVSPLWLTIKDTKWQPSEVIRTAVLAGGFQAWHDEEGTHVPLRLLTGVEEHAVVRDALQKLMAIAALLPAPQDGATEAALLPT